MLKDLEPDEMTDAVANGVVRGLIVSAPGVGKSFGVETIPKNMTQWLKLVDK